MDVRPGFVVTAPVRIADVGGWTDTWFAGSGRVCSIAVRPGARVTVRPGGTELVVSVAVTGERFVVDPVELGDDEGLTARHPVLAAAIAALRPPGGLHVEIAADVPAGSGLGTSAAVSVALLAGLARVREIDLSAAELAAMAHGVERRAGLESGVQDQWAAAHGGIADLSVEYPGARHRRIETAPGVRRDLDTGLITVYLGRPHSSSEVHEQVIAGFAARDPTLALTGLRDLAGDAVDALVLGDLAAFGRTLTAAHETVRSFHPGLVSADADRVTAVAERHGALGWKANGAAGDGGSVTMLARPDESADELRSALTAIDGVTLLDHRISDDGVVITADAAD